jgi:NADH dehydrogenase (ubiquinone) 1 alpha subcomplex subunit 9
MWNKGFGIYKAPVFVSDVAEGIVNAIFDNASLGKTYEALGPRRYELHDMVLYINRLTNRAESDLYTIKDIRFKFFFWFRVWVEEQLYKYPVMTWEGIELESTTDRADPSNPTLEDLGVKLSLFEDLAPFYAGTYDRLGYYDTELGEIPAPPPPKFEVV